MRHPQKSNLTSPKQKYHGVSRTAHLVGIPAKQLRQGLWKLETRRLVSHMLLVPRAHPHRMRYGSELTSDWTTDEHYPPIARIVSFVGADYMTMVPLAQLA